MDFLLEVSICRTTVWTTAIPERMGDFLGKLPVVYFFFEYSFSFNCSGSCDLEQIIRSHFHHKGLIPRGTFNFTWVAKEMKAVIKPCKFEKLTARGLVL